MEVKFNRADVKEKLRLACQVAGAKIVDAYSSVKLSKVGDVLDIRATNSIISIWTTVKLKGNDSSEGGVIVNAKELNALVDRAPDADMILKENEKNIEFISGSFKAKLSKLPVESYPDFKIESVGAVKINFEFFRDAIEKASLYLSENGSISGIAFGEGYIMATSGIAVTIIKTDELSFPRVIVPADILNVVQGIKTDSDSIYMGVKDKSIVFQCGDVLITSRTVEGTYPDVLTPVEKFKTDLKLEVNRKEFLGMLGRAKLLMYANKEKPISTAIKIKVDKPNGVATYHTTFSNGEGNETTESYPCVGWDGEEFDCPFNMINLEGAVSLLKKGVVCMKLGLPNENGRKMPMVIEEDNYRAVLLPINR